MYSDRVLALLELSNDMFYPRIPRQRLGEYTSCPLTIGREVAVQHSGRDIFELYAEHDILIDYKKSVTSKYGVMLRGQAVMGKNERRVELYESSIRALSGNSAFGDLPAPDYDLALKIHLAHEFFHFWEYLNNRFVSEEMDRVETFKLFGFARRVNVARCSEVAAHAFAKELLALPCLANLYDYSYLITQGSMTMDAFEQQINEAQSLLA